MIFIIGTLIIIVVGTYILFRRPKQFGTKPLDGYYANFDDWAGGHKTK